MRKAIIIAIAVHCCLLLAAGYIYVMRPEKREAVFRAFLHAEKTAPMKKIRTVPPKKELKKTPAVRPLRRERPIELIAVKKAITSAFTVKLPEVSGTAYSPQIAVVSIPEPTVAPERLSSFWKNEIKLKDREIRLESFGVTTLKPVGSPENPITRMIFRLELVGAGYHNEVGIYYPIHKPIVMLDPRCGSAETFTGQMEIHLAEPIAVPPEQVIFYLRSQEEGVFLLSTNPLQCRITKIGSNTFRYDWEDQAGGGDQSFGNVIFTIAFMGIQLGM